MRTVRGIPADEITPLWPRLEPLISRALERNSDYTLNEARRSLQRKQRQLFATWPEIDLIWITSIEQRPAAKVLIVWAVAGRLHRDWHEMLRATEGWGRSMGCTKLEARGRLGWARVLPHGYRTEILYQKDLT